jgi:3'-phosphoadenosine 5'-phosphosulfate (PAPS) 3'-phosphatase
MPKVQGVHDVYLRFSAAHRWDFVNVNHVTFTR